ncbi:hypothetical protein GPB2148_2353 [marine gamma proteobacterium HTCC2148]|nr:hypothetical protein GPB2148_2353 [marine gamma proteobacterium HTCC2148]
MLSLDFTGKVLATLAAAFCHIAAAQTVTVLNYNVSGHLTPDYTNERSAYNRFFEQAVEEGAYESMDFIGTVEMLPGVDQDFADALESANSYEICNRSDLPCDTGELITHEFHRIGRVRGGLSGQSEDEMVSIFYNTSKWELVKYDSLTFDDAASQARPNPVLSNNCQNYTLDLTNRHEPCALALQHFMPSENELYHYSFPLNYADDDHRENYFPGDTKNEWGPWNRLATFGVFAPKENSGLPIDKDVIVVATHFPKGKEDYVIYKKDAFEAVYNYVIKPLIESARNPSVIFLGDLNFKPNRDAWAFDLLDYIGAKSVFSGSVPCGLDDDVMWTFASPDLAPKACQIYPEGETEGTTDHIVTQVTYEITN